MHVVHSLILGIYITRVMILGSARVLITDQCSSQLFKCNIAMSYVNFMANTGHLKFTSYFILFYQKAEEIGE